MSLTGPGTEPTDTPAVIPTKASRVATKPIVPTAAARSAERERLSLLVF